MYVSNFYVHKIKKKIVKMLISIALKLEYLLQMKKVSIEVCIAAICYIRDPSGTILMIIVAFRLRQ